MAVAWAVVFLCGATQAVEVSFVKKQLETRFLSEGVTVADVNHDGHPDVIAGPYWFAGPDFNKKTEMRAPLAYDPESYSDAFIMYAHDFDHDGWPDILQVGWPGREALWFRNPGPAGGDWARHVAFPTVGTESPLFVDLAGDGTPKLVFATDKKLGWAAPGQNAAELRPWRFNPLTPEGGWHRYTHGLGVGDVNGDGVPDLLAASGWWEQPAPPSNGVPWRFHPANFGQGGAQMFAYDVNGDGRADIITSIKAHGYGLSWFEQMASVDGNIGWREHAITSRDPSVRLQGVQFSQPHALALADIDGDGLKDIVTGKRRWAHGSRKDPEPDAPPVLYWFRLVRHDGTGRYEPHLIDEASGVGTQFAVADLDGDSFPDIAVSNKSGVFVFLQRRDR